MNDFMKRDCVALTGQRLTFLNSKEFHQCIFAIERTLIYKLNSSRAARLNPQSLRFEQFTGGQRGMNSTLIDHEKIPHCLNEITQAYKGVFRYSGGFFPQVETVCHGAV